MTNEQKQAIASMRDSGVPITSIAQQLGLSVNTIKSYCKRHGIHSGNQSSKNILFCLQCHKEIPQAEHRKAKKFCSDKCRQLWWAENTALIPRDSQIERICPVCGFTCYLRSLLSIVHCQLHAVRSDSHILPDSFIERSQFHPFHFT